MDKKNLVTTKQISKEILYNKNQQQETAEPSAVFFIEYKKVGIWF